MNQQDTAKPTEHYDPPGVEFLDNASGRIMKLVTSGSYEGWLLFRHPDGQWVTERRATNDDKRKVYAVAAPAACGKSPSDRIHELNYSGKSETDVHWFVPSSSTQGAREWPIDEQTKRDGLCTHHRALSVGGEYGGCMVCAENEASSRNAELEKDFRDQVGGLRKMLAEAESRVAALPAQILEALGMVSDEPITVDDALRAIRDRELTRNTWERKAELKLKENKERVAALTEVVGELEKFISAELQWQNGEIENTPQNAREMRVMLANLAKLVSTSKARTLTPSREEKP